MTATTERLRNNPVFWLMWLLPASAVVAGFLTLAIAVQGADRALPESYHWEGERLDADFARLRAAAARGVAVSLEVAAPGGCVARVNPAPDSATLMLLITSGTDASLDRRLLLQRAADGNYRAACEALPAGHWRVELRDDAASWSIRGRFKAPVARIELRARDPETGA